MFFVPLFLLYGNDLYEGIVKESLVAFPDGTALFYKAERQYNIRYFSEKILTLIFREMSMCLVVNVDSKLTEKHITT